LDATPNNYLCPEALNSGKQVQLTLPKAVQAEYSRGTVTSAQKAGRKQEEGFRDSNIDSANVVEGKHQRATKRDGFD
jgi:hypothetical protein